MRLLISNIFEKKNQFVQEVPSLFLFKLNLNVQVLENGRIYTSFKHIEKPYIKSNTHHFACKHQ